MNVKSKVKAGKLASTAATASAANPPDSGTPPSISLDLTMNVKNMANAGGIRTNRCATVRE